jgi:hypothetical protein
VGSDTTNHPALRYAKSPVRSMITQASWACGSIVRRYDNHNLWVFAVRWCPPNSTVWYNNVDFYMRRFGYVTTGKVVEK